jgi:hypothetical protein
MDLRDRLDRDEPGAPPGFLLDPEDQRTHDITVVNVEADVTINNDLATGAGEVEDDELEEQEEGDAA